jgi:hypothetical protein
MKNEGSDDIKCVCSGCAKEFWLRSQDDAVKGVSAFVRIRSCESGGIYAIFVDCPFCGHTHDLD